MRTTRKLLILLAVISLVPVIFGSIFSYYYTKNYLSPDDLFRFRNLLVFFTFGVSLLNILLALYITFSLTQPIRKIIRAAKEISKGNLPEKIEAAADDDIGYLASVFNEMTAKLKDSYGAANSKNQELAKKVAELNTQKAKDEAVLSSIGDGLVVLDKDGQILFVNRIFEELLGFSATEVLGKNIADVVPIEDEQGSPIAFKLRILSLVLSTGKKINTAAAAGYYFVRRDKTRFPIIMTATPIIFDDKIIGAIEIFRDITHEKEVDQAKIEFVSIASHQIRTPISIVNWYTEAVLGGKIGPLNDKQKKYLGEIYTATKRMATLINDILNTSRIDLGTFAIKPQPVSLMEIINREIEQLKPKTSEKKLTVSEKYADDIPIIKADPRLTQIIVHNILTNAVKYTPEDGRLSIEISLEKNASAKDGLKSKGSVLLTVTDTGCGIPKDQQPHIFTKLFRADNAKEKDPEGSGLGLYVVKSILDRAGGEIWFESEEGKGSTFYVRIPLEGMAAKEGAKELTVSQYSIS